MNDGMIIVHTAVESESEAHRLARQLLAENLAGCVNVGSPVLSFYHWEGQEQETEELPLLIKTIAEKQAEIKNWLRENHPYDCPEIAITTVEDVNSSYLDWLREQVGCI